LHCGQILLSQAFSIISADPLAGDPETGAEDDTPEPGTGETRTLAVPAEGHGQRLDRVLAARVPEFSRSFLQQLVGAGAVRLDGAPVIKPAQKLRAGDVLDELRPRREPGLRAQAMDLVVPYEDEHLLVVDKPAGLVVHPAPGNWAARCSTPC
jgi:23S rRNA pseudouridine1911/1915/1917 synthase